MLLVAPCAPVFAVPAAALLLCCACRECSGRFQCGELSSTACPPPTPSHPHSSCTPVQAGATCPATSGPTRSSRSTRWAAGWLLGDTQLAAADMKSAAGGGAGWENRHPGRTCSVAVCRQCVRGLCPNGEPVGAPHLQTFDNMHRALRPCVTAALQSSSHPTACHRFPSADL